MIFVHNIIGKNNHSQMTSRVLKAVGCGLAANSFIGGFYGLGQATILTSMPNTEKLLPTNKREVYTKTIGYNMLSWGTIPVSLLYPPLSVTLEYKDKIEEMG